LVKEVVELIDAKVTIHCDDALTVFVDADLFIQALANLIANAVQHGSGAEVVVEARAVSHDLVEIDIADPEAPVSDAIELRRRFRSGAGRDGGGFGLGLSIADQSLEAIGARLLLNGGSARVQLARGGAR
jgi:signal transduction histidine kinase